MNHRIHTYKLHDTVQSVRRTVLMVYFKEYCKKCTTDTCGLLGTLDELDYVRTCH